MFFGDLEVSFTINFFGCDVTKCKDYCANQTDSHI